MGGGGRSIRPNVDPHPPFCTPGVKFNGPKHQNCMVILDFEASIIIAEVSPFELRHEVHNRSDQRISRGVAGNAANDTETLATEILGECAAQVGKGIFGPLGRGITPRRGLV